MGSRRVRSGATAPRSVFALGLCGLQAGLANAELAARGGRVYTEVDPAFSGVLLTKAQVQAAEEAKAVAEAHRMAVMRVTGVAAAALGARELMLLRKERRNQNLVTPPEAPRSAHGRVGELGAAMLAAVGLTAGVAFGASVKRRRRYTAELRQVAVSLREAQVTSAKLQAENAELQAQILSPPTSPCLSRQTTEQGALMSLSRQTTEQGPLMSRQSTMEVLDDAFVDVFVRIRPPAPWEHGPGAERCVFVQGNEVSVDDGTNEQHFGFKGVLDSSDGAANQEEVFHTIGMQAVQSVLDGYSTCIFSLGQTGTGKTHTLIGSLTDPGLLPRIVNRLLQTPQPCRLTCVELYMDKIRDLLADEAGEKPLEVRGDTGSFYIPNLREVAVEDASAAMKLIGSASRSRSTARTSMNACSSRGHAIYQLEFATGAKLCVVDLAGRENERSTGCRGQNLAELAYINKSLFHLTLVLQALARRSPRSVVPFRNSKLTMLLSESLQGAKTMLVATVSSDQGSADETLTTMRLAQAVSQITTRSRKHNGGLPMRRVFSLDKPESAREKARGSWAAASLASTASSPREGTAQTARSLSSVASTPRL